MGPHGAISSLESLTRNKQPPPPHLTSAAQALKEIACLKPWWGVRWSRELSPVHLQPYSLGAPKNFKLRISFK